MTFEINTERKDHYIELFRKNNFNCFPIPQNQKVADRRYQAEFTTPNQPITKEENYGIIPTRGGNNAIIDFDNKERYRVFAEQIIKKGYMVIETGRGWHIPVIGLTGNVSKIELFDYNYQPNEKIIEIQGSKHYCVGVGSIVLHDKLEKIIHYENKGTDKIWNKNGMDFHDFVDKLCSECKVQARKKKNPGSYKYLRDNFLLGKIPTKGLSNDYFHQAGIQCNTDGLTKEQAFDKIRVVYDKWVESDNFSGRSWGNIEAKINDVYENNQTITRGRPTKDSVEIDRTGIAEQILTTRKLYSDVDTHDIFENKSGFLERINNNLKKELFEKHPEIERADQDSILFKLEAGAEPIPPTNRDFIVFKNGKVDTKKQAFTESDEIADMGFKDYNYLPKSKETEPTEFIKVLYDNILEDHRKRVNAGLKAILRNRVDPKISILYGDSGVGKSTPLNILCFTLGDEYAYPVELNQFLEDRATRAHIKGKRLVVFQDLPKQWKDFTIIKNATGELKINLRGFQQDNTVTDNKIKFWATGNYLTDIPVEEKDAMFTRRLSLIHNIRTEPYEDNPEFAEDIAKNEGEKIISWILNLSDDECQYEDKATVKAEWEGIASPEIGYLNGHWQPCTFESKKTVIDIATQCMLQTGHRIEIDQMIKSMKVLGYSIKDNIIKNIVAKTPTL